MKKYLISFAFFLSIFACVSYQFALRYGYAGKRFWFALAAFILILVPYFSLSLRRVVLKLRELVGANNLFSVLLVSSALIPYLIYSLGVGVFNWVAFAKLILLIYLPYLLIASVKTASQKLYWQDVVAIIVLLLPLKVPWFDDIWPWPRHQIGNFLFKLLAADLLIFMFLIVRSLNDVGYTFLLRRVDIRVALLNLIIFLPVAIPLGLITKFVHLSLDKINYTVTIPMGIGIYFFTAYFEELLFRGILLNLLRKSLNQYAGLIISSFIFGLAHLPGLDWRYFLLATFAGFIYGNAYLRTKTLAAPSLVHTLVVLIQKLLFRR